MMGGFGWKAAGCLGLELWMVCHILLLQTTDTGSFEKRLCHNLLVQFFDLVHLI